MASHIHRNLIVIDPILNKCIPMIRDKSQITKSKSEIQLQMLRRIISLSGKTGFIQKNEEVNRQQFT